MGRCRCRGRIIERYSQPTLSQIPGGAHSLYCRLAAKGPVCTGTCNNLKGSSPCPLDVVMFMAPLRASLWRYVHILTTANSFHPRRFCSVEIDRPCSPRRVCEVIRLLSDPLNCKATLLVVVIALSSDLPLSVEKMRVETRDTYVQVILLS